jgi:hypothetical protein
MIDAGRRKKLILEAQRLANDLSSFRTPGSADPVDPSRLAEPQRFLRSTPDLGQLPTFLKLLPGSYLSRMSASAAPQLKEVANRVAPLVRHTATAEEMIFLLRWAQRLLSTRERRGQGPVGPRRDGHAAPPRR